MSKTMRTGTIRYNITDRGRKYVGQARQFDVAKVVAIINGGAVQELVNKGDMFGYLGHGVRADFGLLPDESVVTPTKDGGTQFTPIDPCCRTVSIKAYPDGTIEHEAEFIDNKLGHTAWEWFQNKIGGFSSVFAPSMENPTMFYGFDYVRMPNFDGNRGYVMDSALFEIDPNRLTSRQKALLMKERLEEKAVIMDAVALRLHDYQIQFAAEQQANAALTADFNRLQAAYDEAVFEKRDMEHRLSVLTPKPEPMLRLNGKNWLTESCTPAVMDSISEVSDQIVIDDQKTDNSIDIVSQFIR